MSWERQKRQLERMTPEEQEAFMEKRRAQQRASWHRKVARERAAGIRPKEPIKGRPRPTKAQIAARKAESDVERAERAAKYAEKRAAAKRRAVEERRNGGIQAFLAQGAQENGFTAFLRSQEIRIADQLTRARGDIAA